MTFYTLFSSFFLAFLLPGAPAHEYHISKTNVRYVAEQEQVQIEMHLFVEDLEKDMMAGGAPKKLEIGTEIEHPQAADLLKAYLDQQFLITWNEEPLPLTIVGYELEDDLHGLWIYLSSEGVPAPEAVEVTTTLLTETYPDQKNIVKIYNGAERGATLLMSRQRTSAEYIVR